jgi:ceramide glucosyltransferase
LFDCLAGFATLYYFFALWCVIAFFSRKPSRPTNWTPPLSILKPVKGLDEEAFENFASFCRQDYSGYEILFGVESREDPSVPVIERLIRTFPELHIQLVVVESVNTVNRKVGILEALVSHARHDLLIISDADVRVPPNYLKEIVTPFQEPKMGMVTCLYRISGSKNLPAALESMMIHLDFFPAVLVAERLEGIAFGLGATMAIRKSALLTIGGFKRIGDYLADDYLLGRLIHQAGYRLLLSTVVVDIIQEKLSTAGFFEHQLRWARTYKTCRPKGYFASILTHGVFISMLYFLISGFSPLGRLLFSITCAVRLLMGTLILGRYLKEPGWRTALLRLPFKEILSAGIWGFAFLGNTVSWKENVFRVDRNGRMIRVERSS